MDVTIDDITGIFSDNIMYGSAPTTNYGASTWMRMQETSTQKYRGLMSVDLSGIVGTVTNAYLGLDSYSGTYPITLVAREILVPWVEGLRDSSAAQEGESSWQYTEKDNEWNTWGCSEDGTDRIAASVGQLQFTANNSDTHFPIDNDSVQRMIDSPSTNYGWVFQSDTIEAVKQVIFRSSEAVTGNKPYLYVEYTEVAEAALFSRGRMINL